MPSCHTVGKQQEFGKCCRGRIAELPVWFWGQWWNFAAHLEAEWKHVGKSGIHDPGNPQGEDPPDPPFGSQHNSPGLQTGSWCIAAPQLGTGDVMHIISNQILYIHTLKNTVTDTACCQAVLQIQLYNCRKIQIILQWPIVQSLMAGSLQKKHIAHPMWAQIQSPVVPVTQSLQHYSCQSHPPVEFPTLRKSWQWKFNDLELINVYPPSLHRDCVCIAYLYLI